MPYSVWITLFLLGVLVLFWIAKARGLIPDGGFTRTSKGFFPVREMILCDGKGGGGGGGVWFVLLVS